MSVHHTVYAVHTSNVYQNIGKLCLPRMWLLMFMFFYFEYFTPSEIDIKIVWVLDCYGTWNINGVTLPQKSILPRRDSLMRQKMFLHTTIQQPRWEKRLI